MVVGFDGSEPAYRALDAATQLISGRTASIVAVYVAYLPATVALAPEGLLEFTEAVRSRLDLVEQRCRLERRPVTLRLLPRLALGWSHHRGAAAE